MVSGLKFGHSQFHRTDISEREVVTSALSDQPQPVLNPQLEHV